MAASCSEFGLGCLLKVAGVSSERAWTQLLAPRGIGWDPRVQLADLSGKFQRLVLQLRVQLTDVSG